MKVLKCGHIGSDSFGAKPELGGLISTVEKSVFAATVILSIFLHIYFFQNAGGFWRDEVTSLQMIQVPSILEVWNKIEFDSFPLFWHLFLRGCSAIPMLGSEWGLRFVGLAIGLSIIAAVLYNARFIFKTPFPIITIAIIGTNPDIIRWGDSMRAYGLGVLLITITTGLIWRVLNAPTKSNFATTLIFSILSVQTLYFNSVLLFCICCSCLIVAIRNGRRKSFLSILLIGVISASTMLPYLIPMQRVDKIIDIVRIHFSLDIFLNKIAALLTAQGDQMLFIWILIFILFVGGTCVLLWRPFMNITSDRNDLILFNISAVLLIIGGYFIFLKVTVSYITEPWYYIPLVVLVLLFMELTISLYTINTLPMLARSILILVILVSSFRPALASLENRQTNVDLIAAQLNTVADKNDLVLVTKWEAGTTFNYYYNGPARWMTVPAIESHTFQRYDLVKRFMYEADPLKKNFQEIEKTLSSGHRLWIVGVFPPLPRQFKPPILGPPPLPRTGLHLTPYNANWIFTLSHYVQTHCTKAVSFRIGEHVNKYEYLPLTVVEGWSPDNSPQDDEEEK